MGKAKYFTRSAISIICFNDSYNSCQDIVRECQEMGWGVHRVSAADSDVLRVDVTNSGKIASL